MMIFLLACAVTPEDSAAEADYVDERLEAGDVDPVPEGGEQWYGPDLILEAGADVQYCTFGTYTGPDIAITSFESFQASPGHHLIILGTTASTVDYADGETVDCTKTNQMMTSFEPLINAEPIDAGRSEIVLPGGMGVKLNEGQRWVVQSHYVNTTTDRIRVRDVMNIGFAPEEEIEIWAAAFALTQTNLSLPPAQESSLSFDCHFDEQYELMYLTGHMHEYGTEFSFEYGEADTLETIYEIPVWQAEYRDRPPLNKYAPGEFLFNPGSTLRTNCTWFNDTDEAIAFPDEMCATYGMLYPSLSPVVCSD